MSRRHDPTKARRHWVYTREELCAKFDIGDSTITNWIRRGLEPVDGKRPQLFAGYKLRQFLTEMRWPHGRPPENGRIFCPTCLGFKSLLAGIIETLHLGIGCFTVRGKCIDCHDMLQAGTTPGEVGQIFAASGNTAEDSSDVIDAGVLRGIRRNGATIPPETSSLNLRWLHGYRVFLESHQEFDVRTVDEHLRAMSRMSAFLSHKPFETITIADVLQFKDELRNLRDLEGGKGLSRSTVLHTLDRCTSFFTWLRRRPEIDMDPDLPGYFKLSRSERSAESSMVKGTSLNFDQAFRIFAGMPASSSVELRDRAIIAMFIITGIRIAALITLRGKHVNTHTRWIDQDPREVDTKFGKRIRTYCLDLGLGLLDAITQWARWRDSNGFGDDAPFFLPDRFIQPNCIGLGYRPSIVEAAQCWKSDDPVQRIIKDAAHAAGLLDDGISSHDFRKMLHPFLSKRGNMLIVEEVALQLNFGQTPVETIRKHYASMLDCEREAILDELCRRALSHRTQLELYLAFERNLIAETDPDFRRAKDIFERNSRSGEMPGEALL
jgi:site-specific recombinase XerC